MDLLKCSSPSIVSSHSYGPMCDKVELLARGCGHLYDLDTESHSQHHNLSTDLDTQHINDQSIFNLSNCQAKLYLDHRPVAVKIDINPSLFKGLERSQPRCYRAFLHLTRSLYINQCQGEAFLLLQSPRRFASRVVMVQP